MDRERNGRSARRVLVAGAGALGTVLGGFLRRAGHAVTLLGRSVHMEAIRLTQANYRDIAAHALETFPDECCGVVIQRQGRQEIVRVKNVQGERHAKDPASFPRTALTAYIMGPEVAPTLIEHERGSLVIEAFYHSHPQHDAYFSTEDCKQAMPWGDEPNYPDAGQIVISIYDRQVEEVKAFRWNQGKRDFIGTSLKVL